MSVHRGSAASNHPLSLALFQNGEAELWKPERKVKCTLLKATEKECKELLMYFSVQATIVFALEVLPAEDCYWDTVRSTVMFSPASCPSPPGLIQKYKPPLLQSRESLCEQAQGQDARAQVPNNRCVVSGLCGTYPLLISQGCDLLTVLPFLMEYHPHL